MSESVFVTIGGTQVSVSIEGGNLAIGSSLSLQELNDAVAQAEAAAALAGTAGAAAGAIAGASSGAVAGSSAGASSGSTAGTAAANVVVAGKANTILDNVTDAVFGGKTFESAVASVTGFARSASDRFKSASLIYGEDNGVTATTNTAPIRTANTTNINSALAAKPTNQPGGLVLQNGDIWINDTLVIDEDNVGLLGRGGAFSHGAGTFRNAKTTIRWGGAAGGTMIKLKTPYGATAQRRYGMFLKNIELSGESIAAVGVEVDSVAAGLMENVHVRHCTDTQYRIISGITGTNGPAGEALDTQKWLFSRCSFDTRNTSYATSTAKGWTIDGSINSNCSGNVFMLCDGLYADGAGWYIPRADNNVFLRCSATRATGVVTNVYTWDLLGSNGPTGQGAYANLWLSVGWNATYGMRMGASLISDSAYVRNNFVLKYDQANGAGPPTFGTNSNIVSVSQSGEVTGFIFNGLRIQQPGTGPNDGIIAISGSNRFDQYGSGDLWTFGGNGFQARYAMVGALNLVLGDLSIAGTSVVKTRRTGWSGGTGPARRTGFTTSTVTTAELAEVMKALIDDLFAHGLIGT